MIAIEDQFAYDVTITRQLNSGETESRVEHRFKPFFDVVSTLDATRPDLHLLSIVLWSGLISEDEDITIDDVRKLLQPLEFKELAYVYEQIDRAVYDSSNDSDMTYEEAKRKAAELTSEIERPKNLPSIGGNVENLDTPS
jgi:hypothetical protein